MGQLEAIDGGEAEMAKRELPASEIAAASISETIAYNIRNNLKRM
jgi:hypothetical protein